MKERACLALGFFDSVHCGHRHIIEKLTKKADLLLAKSVVSTFSDSFSSNSPKPHKLVYTLSERQKILSSLNVSSILPFDFTSEFSRQSPSEFLASLENMYDIQFIICGYDYRFGARGAGDTGTLRLYCRENNIELEVVDKVCRSGERVSTSMIKELLSEGRIERANELLCDEYFMCGTVTAGRGEGRKNSFPTANICIKNEKFLPKLGVYATKTEVFGSFYNSVTSIGLKPTYNDFSLSIETFIEGYDGDIYGEEIKIIFKKYLRDIIKFSSLTELKAQITKDIDQSK